MQKLKKRKEKKVKLQLKYFIETAHVYMYIAFTRDVEL